MVRGLVIFQEWFKDFESQYVLIGGTAALITMTEAGLLLICQWVQLALARKLH